MRAKTVESEESLARLISNQLGLEFATSGQQDAPSIVVFSGISGSGKEALLKRICARLGLTDLASRSPLEIRDCASVYEADCVVKSGLPVFATVHAASNMQALERLCHLKFTRHCGVGCDPLDDCGGIGIKDGSVFVNVSGIKAIGNDYYTWAEYHALNSGSMEGTTLKNRILSGANHRNVDAIRFHKKSDEQLSYEKTMAVLSSVPALVFEADLNGVSLLPAHPRPNHQIIMTFEVAVFETDDGKNPNISNEISGGIGLLESAVGSHKMQAFEAMFCGKIDPNEFELKYGLIA
jgi:hypothetical protein